MAWFSNSYADLYFGSRRPIMSAGTRSGLVEEFELLLRSAFPNKRWELKEAKPMKDGWYKIAYLSIDKSKTNYNESFNKDFYLARKTADGSWDVKGGE